jgi:Haem-degrading
VVAISQADRPLGLKGCRSAGHNTTAAKPAGHLCADPCQSIAGPPTPRPASGGPHRDPKGSPASSRDWIRRKIRVVQPCEHSSLAVGQLWRERGTTFEDVPQFDPRRYSAQGGGFPMLVRSVRPVGTVAVSGLPQLEDHRVVVSTIRAYLSARPPARSS